MSEFLTPFQNQTPIKSSLFETYNHHENEKKRKYERVIEIEHASFTPIIFSLTGGTPNITFINTLPKKLQKKSILPTLRLLHLLDVDYAFALLRSAIMCIRETQLSSPIFNSTIDLQIVESQLTPAI